MDSQTLVNSVNVLESTDPIPKDAKRFTWPFKRARIRDDILSNNGNMESMLWWPTFHESLHAGYTPTVHKELVRLDRQHSLAAIDPQIGIGPPNDLRSTVPLSASGASGTYIRQALALQKIRDFIGYPISQLESIFEFGAGYGALASVACRLGFAGRHTILDFPELLLVQQWYHAQLGISCESEYLTMQDLAVPLDDLPYDVFIAICSLDEAPITVREQILETVSAEHYLIWYHSSFGGVDNREWFGRYFAEGYYTSIEDVQSPHPNQRILYVRR